MGRPVPSGLKRPLLAYFVHGRGRGHASRALSLVPALRGAGYDVRLFASAEALALLRGLQPVEERPLIRRGPAGWVELWNRSEHEALALRSLPVDLVISDGDQAALLGAWRAKVPALAIGHDLVFNRCVVPPELDWAQLLLQRANGLIPSRFSARRVAVSFLPTRASDRHTRVARPALDALSATPASSGRERVVCYFRDANGGSVPEWLRGSGLEVLSTNGKDSAALDPAAFRATVASARGVIASAGSNLIAECVLLGIPLLALYREDDVEQALNASWLAASGAGMACSFERIDAPFVDAFVARARAGTFARFALEQALPSLVDVVLQSVRELLPTSSPHALTPVGHLNWNRFA